MILDGKLVMFKDFDILEIIGEGSFGACFLVERNSDGAIFLMKVQSIKGLVEDEID